MQKKTIVPRAAYERAAEQIFDALLDVAINWTDDEEVAQKAAERGQAAAMKAILQGCKVE